MLYKCEICEKEFDSLASISKHNGRKHGIHSEQTIFMSKNTPDIIGLNLGKIDWLLMVMM